MRNTVEWFLLLKGFKKLKNPPKPLQSNKLAISVQCLLFKNKKNSAQYLQIDDDFARDCDHYSDTDETSVDDTADQSFGTSAAELEPVSMVRNPRDRIPADLDSSFPSISLETGDSADISMATDHLSDGTKTALKLNWNKTLKSWN